MVYSVLEMSLIYCNAFLVALKSTTVFIMRLLELVVVISHLIHCNYYFHVKLTCNDMFLLAPTCIQSEVRLLNDQVQICHNEVWGYICGDSDWTNDDASVVCRELGFSPQGI